MKLEWDADEAYKLCKQRKLFFFIPCDPFTHEPLGERVNGTWQVEYDAAESALLLEMNKRGKDPETVALYEEAAERLRLYAKMDGPGRWIARGKLEVMNKQREMRENGPNA